MKNDWLSTLPLVRDKRLRLSAISVFVVGMLAHAYSYFALYHSHDSISCINRRDEAFQISLGRFLQPVYFELRGSLSVPWLYGALAMLWIALSVYLLVCIFEVKQSVSVVLLGALMSTGTMLAAANATYFSYTDIFMLAFLLSALAVWFTIRWRWGFLPGALCMTLSLGLYQCFVGSACGMLVMLFVLKVTRGDSLRDLCLFALRSVAMLLLGGLCYKLVLDGVLAATGVRLSNGYNGITGVGDYKGYSRMGLIVDAWRYAINTFLAPQTWHPQASAAATLALFAAGLASLGMLLRRFSARLWRVALALLAVGVLPFAANITYFVSKGMIHELMIYPLLLLPAFCVILLDAAMGTGTANRYVCGGVRWTTLCATLLIVGCSIIYSNGAYLNKQLIFQATVSNMNRIIMTMESTEGYAVGKTPVAFVGFMPATSAAMNRPGFESFRAVGMLNQMAVTYGQTEGEFMTYVMGYPVNWVSFETDVRMEEDAAVAAMPSFPTQGYCRMIDGVLVVKLSD